MAGRKCKPLSHWFSLRENKCCCQTLVFIFASRFLNTFIFLSVFSRLFRMKFFIYFVQLLLSFTVVKGYSFTKLYCYKCVSTHPGCGNSFNWLWYWSQQCPEDNDKCVKIIERKGSTEVITRDCLSSLTFRTDIPADQYEGCRPASKDVRLAHYVNNSIHEYDIKRDYYDSTEWCFCFFDNRCNSGSNIYASLALIGAICILNLI